MNLKMMEDGFRMILTGMGENPNREGLLDTPKRVAKMYAELMTGLSGEMRAEDILKTRFHEKYDEMIIVPDIEFASMCEHHFLPFTGKAHVAYIPGDCVVGLSKIPRVVEFYARFPQIQERMTRQIAELIQKELNPHLIVASKLLKSLLMLLHQTIFHYLQLLLLLLILFFLIF